jgi:hypothetical protein
MRQAGMKTGDAARPAWRRKGGGILVKQGVFRQLEKRGGAKNKYQTEMVVID